MALTSDDLYLFNEGTHVRLYDKLGAHPGEEGGKRGTRFAVWAPNAESVSVIGDWNGWNRDAHFLAPRASSGLWEGFVPGAHEGAVYKYHVRSQYRGYRVDKADPVGFFHEAPPKTASIIHRLDYPWGDDAWMKERERRAARDAPMSIYEVHLGSWRRVPEQDHRPLTYREAAQQLTAHVKRLGFSHVEFLPLAEHPFYGSWGYQVTGYFAPTSRYGSPEDFMFLVDSLHQAGIGVIMDWVPAHFPTDEHGLGFFDGSHLYEHADERQGFHPDWKSYIFNYGRHEVQSFLLSSAHFWLDKFHIDGLRVDGVASMLYLDYSRKEGEWIPNRYGGRENLEAVNLLRRLNEVVYRDFPSAQTVAEESTAWPGVSKPTSYGGLGFGYKWDMGWMHDTLKYMGRDPVHRKFHQNDITFRMIYAFTENYVLPLSHDEVVHGKGSLLAKMPGDRWQKFANLRLLFAYMYAQPGKKLLFMGSELAPWNEWNHEHSLDWHLDGVDEHGGVARLITDLNRLYRETPALHDLDCETAGFEWVDASDAASSVLAFLRRGAGDAPPLLVACNFTPTPRQGYRLGVPRGGRWREVFNSDAGAYAGSGLGNAGGVVAEPTPMHGREHSLSLTLPPLAALFFVPA